MAAALVCLWIGRAFWFYAGYVLTIVAALLLVPTVSLWFARALRPVLKWIRPVEGSLAADSSVGGATAARRVDSDRVVAGGGPIRCLRRYRDCRGAAGLDHDA